MHSGPTYPPPPPYVMLNDQGASGHYPGPHGRNPPRFNGQYRPNGRRKSTFLRFYCCCYCCVFITLVVIIAAGIISFIIVSPRMPEYKINDFSVKAFNITPDANLVAHFVVTVKAENPNQKISIIYEKGSCVNLLYSGMKLCSGIVPHFRQPTKNTTMIHVDLKGDLKASDLGGSLGQSLVEKMKSDRIPLTVAVRVPVNIGMGSTHVLKDPMGVYVTCSMVINNLSEPDKKVQISETKYNIDFSINFKKLRKPPCHNFEFKSYTS